MRDLFGNEYVRYSLRIQGLLFLGGIVMLIWFREISHWIGVDAAWILGIALVLLIQFGLAKKKVTAVKPSGPSPATSTR